MKQWTEEEDLILENLYKDGYTTKDIAVKLNRTYDSVQHRISNKKLRDKYIKNDLTGKQFDRLTVLGLDHIDYKGMKHWICVCNCKDKNIVVVPTDRLNSGKTKSCGCIRKEKLREKRKSFNNYYIVGDVTYIQYNNSYDCFIIDTEDLDRVKNYCWYNHNGYPYTHLNNEKQICISKILLNVTDDKLQVDHKNGRGTEWDNRKSNLRVCTNQQNSFNKGLKSTNKSGYVGVYYSEQYNAWIATITYNYKTYHLGVYDTKEEAYASRLRAERKLWDYEFIPDERKTIDISELLKDKKD